MPESKAKKVIKNLCYSNKLIYLCTRNNTKRKIKRG